MIALPVTVVAEIEVALCVPVTSPDRFPVKLPALPLTLPVNAPLNAGAVTVPVNAGEASGALRASLPFSLLIAVRIVSLAVILPAPEVKFVRAFPVTVVAEIAVALCVPVTSPDRLPVKLAALPEMLPVRLPENAGAVTVPVKVGDASGAFNASLPFSLLIAVRIVSLAVILPAPEVKFVRAFPVTVVAEIAVALCGPVTSPDRLPVKLPALPLTLPVTLPARGPLKAGAVTVPLNVGEAEFAFNPTLPSSLLIADKIVSLAVILPAPEAKFVRIFPVTVDDEIEVELWVPVTSPASEPVKFPALAPANA